MHELLGNVDGAEQEYRRAISLDPSDTQALVQLARILSVYDGKSQMNPNFVSSQRVGHEGVGGGLDDSPQVVENADRQTASPASSGDSMQVTVASSNECLMFGMRVRGLGHHILRETRPMTLVSG